MLKSVPLYYKNLKHQVAEHFKKKASPTRAPNNIHQEVFWGFLSTTHKCRCLFLTQKHPSPPTKTHTISCCLFFFGWFFLAEVETDPYSPRSPVFLCKVPICTSPSTVNVNVTSPNSFNQFFHDQIPSKLTGSYLPGYATRKGNYHLAFPSPYHPWDWYIYLHLVVFNGKPW